MPQLQFEEPKSFVPLETQAVLVGQRKLRWKATAQPSSSLETAHRSLLALTAEMLRLRIQEPSGTAAPKSWDEQNARRITLIHKNVAQTITRAEAQELEDLQRAAADRARAVAPVPLQDLKDYIEKLKQGGIVIPD